MSNLETDFNLVDVDALFKERYGVYYENVYNDMAPTYALLKKNDMFTGELVRFPVPLGYKGGIGAKFGAIEHTNASYGKVQIEDKLTYAKSIIERRTIMAARDDAGSFVRAIDEEVKKTTESYKWNQARMFMGDGTLGTISSVTDNGGGDYDLVITDATWIVGNWEENMIVNIGPTDTSTVVEDGFQITEVDPDNKTVSVQRMSGGVVVPDAVTNKVVYMQASAGLEFTGLRTAFAFAAGTLYNVAYSRRWSSYAKDASASVSIPLINDVITNVMLRTGKAPKVATCGYTQYGKIKDLLEDLKRYNPVTQKVGMMSYKGIEILTDTGTIKLFPDKFMHESEIWFLNFDYMEQYRRPGHGWVNEDVKGLNGSGYLRLAGDDSFEGRIACYGDNFIAPPFQGRLYNLTV